MHPFKSRGGGTMKECREEHPEIAGPLEMQKAPVEMWVCNVLLKASIVTWSSVCGTLLRNREKRCVTLGVGVVTVLGACPRKHLWGPIIFFFLFLLPRSHSVSGFASPHNLDQALSLHDVQAMRPVSRMGQPG